MLGRTELSPSGQDGPPSKPNRACKPPSRARAEGLLGLLGLITGLLTDSPGQWTPDTGQDSGTVDSGHRTEQWTGDRGMDAKQDRGTPDTRQNNGQSRPDT